jgi:hypothetical protein
MRMLAGVQKLGNELPDLFLTIGKLPALERF